MALYVSITINDEQPIHTFGAQNVTGKNVVGENNVYRVCKYVNGKPVFIPGLLHHKRGDGAIVLAQKLLERIVQQEMN